MIISLELYVEHMIRFINSKEVTVHVLTTFLIMKLDRNSDLT